MKLIKSIANKELVEVEVTYDDGREFGEWKMTDMQKVTLSNLGDIDDFLEVTFFIPKWWEFWKMLRVKIVVKPKEYKGKIDFSIN